MLSALAKYIFGGVLNEAPETTSMQYETREINDWLLVDMPDQDIDNEDMDSESEDDDILTSVPLLLAEEVSMSPRQIVLSYEADSSCDKSYTKIRKGFHDKIHSASSKVQVHAGDKIQGNFVANVEAISLETENICNDKVQHNLSETQENIKPKQSKSKNSKSKKSKKNKIDKKCNVKVQDKSAVKKKYSDNVQEKSSDKIVPNLKNKTYSISNEIPESSDIKTECTLADKFEDSRVTITSDSSIKTECILADKFEDSYATIISDSSIKTECTLADKFEDSHVTIISDSSHKNTDKIENHPIITTDNATKKDTHKVDDFPTAITNNGRSKNQNVYDNFFEKCGSKFQVNVTDKISKDLDKNVTFNANEVESNLNITGKRSYADVLKTNFDAFENDSHKVVAVEEVCKNESEFPEISLPAKTQHIQSKCKKSKSKQMRKTKRQNKSDIKSQNIPTSASISYSDDVEIAENFNNDKNISDEDVGISNIRSVDTTCSTTCENLIENELENYSNKVIQEDIYRNKSLISQEQQNCESIQDVFPDKDEETLMSVSENFESMLQDMSDAQGTENVFTRNLNYNSTQNGVLQKVSMDNTFFSSSYNENKSNFMDSCQILCNKVNDNYKANSFEFQQNSDDRALENIAGLWDIYTKILENSDDEIHEISDDEMNENFNKDLQKVPEMEMIDNSDDEMNENSQDEYEEMYDDERSCNRIFKNFFGKENGKTYKRAYEYSPAEESEESSDEMFTDMEDHFILPSFERITNKNSELLQSFKCNFFEELKQNSSEIPKHHSSCIPFAEYELVEYFNFEPQYFYACQSLQYPSSYALAIAEYYSSHDQYFPKYSERCNAFIQKYKRRAIVENQTPPTPNEPSLITNSADLLQKIINQKCSVLPTKTAVVLEHVKDLKPIQQAIQLEARKYLTRSQLNRQNRNYIYQSSSKTNRRRNLQRNHSGVNNNRKCY